MVVVRINPARQAPVPSAFDDERSSRHHQTDGLPTKTASHLPQPPGDSCATHSIGTLASIVDDVQTTVILKLQGTLNGDRLAFSLP